MRRRLSCAERTKSIVTTITDRLPPHDAVEAAIARVLDAEQAARLAVAATDQAAIATIEEARAAARAVA